MTQLTDKELELDLEAEYIVNKLSNINPKLIRTKNGLEILTNDRNIFKVMQEMIFINDSIQSISDLSSSEYIARRRQEDANR